MLLQHWPYPTGDMVLENGHITISGRASELMANDDVRQAFLGQDVQKKNKARTLTKVV